MASVNHTKISIYDFFFADKKRKTYTNAAFSLILIIVLLLFALRPTLLTLGSIRDKIKLYKNYNVKLDAKVKAAKNLSQQMNSTSTEQSVGLKNQIDFLNNVFFKDPEIKVFYENLRQRASSNNLVVKTLTPKYINPQQSSSPLANFDNDTSKSPSDSYYLTDFIVEGKDINDVGKFLTTIEGASNYPILSRIKSISVYNNKEENRVKKNTSQSGNLPDSIVVNISIVTYLDSTRVDPNPVIPQNP